MKKSFGAIFASLGFIAALATSPAIGADEHKHDHKITTFESVAAGVKTVDTLIAEIRTKVGKGDFEGLHPTAEEVRAAAEALEARLGDVEAAHKERFKFNTDQLKGVATDLEEAHEGKSKDEAEKVAKRMESIRDRLRSLSP